MIGRDPLRDVAGDRQPFTPAEWAAQDPDEAVIRVQTSAPGLLVVATTWMPGWTATVDGRPAKVERGNHWQQVVALPSPGRHEVILRYVPRGFAAGSLLSASALVLWAGIGLVLAVRVVRPTWEWQRRPAPAPALSACRSA
jgi:hypothetical protein